MSEYTVKFEVFEGPLDLLLYLIRKEEVDIYEVNLTKLASQFVEYLEVMRMLDLDIAGEFLVMASTLMYIKSRELLPKDLQTTPEEEEEGDDPRWELIRQLVEYKKFKDAAAQMQRLELEVENTYPRLPGKPAFLQIEEPGPQKLDVSIFDLVNAVNAILKRVNKREDLREIFEDKWTVSEKIESLIDLTTSQPIVRFTELFAQAESRSEVVCIFLALLELIRMKRLVCAQNDHFGEIEIRTNPNPAVTLATPAQLESEPAPAPTETAAVESGTAS